MVVAAAQCVERDDWVSATDLLERVSRVALGQVRGIGGVNRLSVVGVLSPVGLAPASELAARLGISPAVVETTGIGGNIAQWLVTRAAADIALGRLGTSLIVGAEAMRSVKLDRDRSAVVEARGTFDPVVSDLRPGVSPAETAVGLVLPVHIYAMLESALAHRAGRKPADHRLALGELMAPFTEVAAVHPCAWFPRRRSPAELAEPAADNRLVAEPYTKRLCAFLYVDQAAAVVVTSLAEARRAGVADRAVFVWSGADAADVWFPSARPDLGVSPGIAAAAGATLEAPHVGVAEVGMFDLYSCFPAPVEMACEALGLSWEDPRGLTVTGGLAAFGGPGNNYTTHAIATMVDRLRDSGGLGLVGGLGWYVTKHSYGLYGSMPPPGGFRRGDTSAVQERIDASGLGVVDSPLEEPVWGTVEGSTAIYDAGGVVGAPVIARIDDGRRVVATADGDADLELLRGTSLVGARVRVEGWPLTYHLEET